MNDEDSSMITPPPGFVVPKSAQAEPADVDTDAESFITLPPGVVESGTHRIANPRAVPRPSTQSSDEIVFFPTAPGVPLPTSAPTARSEREDGSDLRGHSSPQWRLVLPDGIGAKAVNRSLFIGRNPKRTPEQPEAELLPLIDPAKSLSKTHALLEIEKGVLWVHDLDSTNGVFIVPQGGETMEVEPGIRSLVPADSDLELGNYVIHIERH